METNTDISTSMDQLVELVDKNNTIKLTDAAKELGVDKEHVESWAKMLEKEDFLKIHYSVVGGAMLKKGSKFETALCAAKHPGATLPQLPKPYRQQAQTPTFPQPVRPSQKAEAPKPPASSEEAAGEYMLIKKRIEDEEAVIKSDLQKLRESQAAVARYMEELEAEQRKLANYATSLRQAVDKIGDKVGSSPP